MLHTVWEKEQVPAAMWGSSGCSAAKQFCINILTFVPYPMARICRVNKENIFLHLLPWTAYQYSSNPSLSFALEYPERSHFTHWVPSALQVVHISGLIYIDTQTHQPHCVRCLEEPPSLLMTMGRQKRKAQSLPPCLFCISVCGKFWFVWRQELFKKWPLKTKILLKKEFFRAVLTHLGNIQCFD